MQQLKIFIIAYPVYLLNLYLEIGFKKYGLAFLSLVFYILSLNIQFNNLVASTRKSKSSFKKTVPFASNNKHSPFFQERLCVHAYR